jgi:hypothetical protein
MAEYEVASRVFEARSPGQAARTAPMELITGNRGVSDPLNARGTRFSRGGGVAHATVPLLSQSESLTWAAQNADLIVERAAG